MTDESFMPTPEELDSDALRTMCMLEIFKQKYLDMVGRDDLHRRIVLRIPGGMSDEAVAAITKRFEDKQWEVTKTEDGIDFDRVPALALSRFASK